MVRKLDRREFLKLSGATAGAATMGATSPAALTSGVRVEALKADYLDRPLGLENPQPRLSWRLCSAQRGVRQNSYRIRVARSEAALVAGRADLWDSGVIHSSKCVGIPYRGRALASRQQCWWNVQVWDNRGGSSSSEVSSWEMGLLEPGDWTAQWLTVERPTDKSDREAGLQWVWGEPTSEKSVRRFRFKWRLPEPSAGGGFYAVTNDWAFFAQITGVWIDGACVSGPYDFVDLLSEPPPGNDSSYVRFPLGPLTEGEHVIAVEVGTAALPPEMADSPHQHGLAVFARVDLKSGRPFRIGSTGDGKTSLTQASNWTSSAYDDSAWESARTVALKHQPWPAQPAMYLRKEIALHKPLRSARLYATALGAYEARINGRRVADALLAPEISQYSKRVLYRVYDVTGMLQTGGNVIGLTVGDGWYGSFDHRFAWDPPPRRVLAQIEVTFEDGSREVVNTDSSWRIGESPIRASEIKRGEIYDARLEQRGWDDVGFDDAHWELAAVGDRPSGRVVAHVSPPIRVIGTLSPQAVHQLPAGVFVFDFGTNFSGWCRLHVSGTRGSQVELLYSERLTGAGEADQSWFSMGAIKKDVYTLRGEGAEEVFEPHFTYRGFRYVQVSGLQTPPSLDCLEGMFVHTDLAITGNLRTSAPLIKQIWLNVLQTQRCNFIGIPTDCPSREQRGWLADPAIFWDGGAFNMDVCAFASRYMDNVVDDQYPDGPFPVAAPEPRGNNAFFHVAGSAPGWGEGGIILPWTTWRRYGDLEIIERNWNAMNRHLQFILDNNADFVWRRKRNWDFGDNLSLDKTTPGNGLPETPGDLIGTAYWAYGADLLGQMAQATGRDTEAQRLRILRDRVRQAFNNTFVRPDGVVGEGSQTGFVLALKFGLLPETQAHLAAERLAADIRDRGVSLTTGILGAQFCLDVLADAGYAELAYGLLLRTEFPSWGYMSSQGATTIWESWSGNDRFGDGTVRLSQDHFALGSVCGFMFRRIAGIDAETPGFETMVVRPILDPRVKSGGGDYDSIMGRISTDWMQHDDGAFTLDVTLPANTTGRIHLPAGRDRRIQEGGKDLKRRNDLRIVSRRDHEALIEAGSGTYRFVVTG